MHGNIHGNSIIVGCILKPGPGVITVSTSESLEANNLPLLANDTWMELLFKENRRCYKRLYLLHVK